MTNNHLTDDQHDQEGDELNVCIWRRYSPHLNNHPDRDLVLGLEEGGRQIALDDYGAGEGPSVSTTIIRHAADRTFSFYETMVFWEGHRFDQKFIHAYTLSDALAAHETMSSLVKAEIKRQYAMLAESPAHE